MLTIEIVSHPLCPFQHRLRLIDHGAKPDGGPPVRFTSLPYSEFPKRIREYSPSGDSPVMLVDGRARSTSTEHIATYLDGLHALHVLPADPAARLDVHTREQRAGEALQSLRDVFTARDAAALNTGIAALFERLRKDEAAGVFAALDPDSRDLDVAAWAGVFTLIWEFPPFVARPEWRQVPQAAEFAHLIVARDDVRATAAPRQSDEFKAFFAMTGSAFPDLIAAQ